jgi:hypothetical protein
MGKETGLKSVALKKKTTLPTKDKGLNYEKVEMATKAIEAKEKMKKTKTTRVTIDIPVERYKEMKIKVIQEGKSVRSYFLELMENDLGK